MTSRSFVDAWRRRKCAAFDLAGNSTAGRALELDLWGRRTRVYANANLSVYSGQTCNARCSFCVEELRPASRGRALAQQRRVEPDDGAYFAALEESLRALKPLDPTVSVTGGEASLDPRLPRILKTLAAAGGRKRTMTTNGSGLLERREGRTVLEWATTTGLKHLNVSRAHPDQSRNERLMRFTAAPGPDALRRIAREAKASGTRPRLSCVLLNGEVDSLEGVVEYLAFARSVGVDNVIFRQLMRTDPASAARDPVVLYSDARRARLEPLLDAVSADPRFSFVRQVVGYYYYVEVWRHAGMDVVFEEADLARLEATKREDPGLVHELVFHPDGALASTWQPWDGVLGPGVPA
ncbi:radical SAM protein [bacterium]|nr:MAG: radical SAM protein [bacterium]